MKKKIQLGYVENYVDYCMLDILTGEKTFYNKEKKKEKGIKGEYFKDEENFFALYSSSVGPIMYYKNKEYQLTPDLHISLDKMGKWREFHIKEYDIHIKYRTSKFIGFDVWSEEEDVDLFYRIEQSYKDNEFYKKYTES